MRRIRYFYHMMMAWCYLDIAKICRPIYNTKIGDRLRTICAIKAIEHIREELICLKTEN